MKNILKILSIVAIITLSACNKDEIPTGQGAVKVSITDGPFPFEFVNQANLGIAKVELKNENGKYITVFEGNTSYNMVELTNGVSADVKTTNIPAGEYSESRVTLNAASVVLGNGDQFNLNAEATATVYVTAIEPSLTVEEGDSSNILFDLDLNQSFSFFGFAGFPFSDWIPSMSMISTCHFEPHFSVCDLDKTGSISGVVTVNGTATENVQVYITVNGHQVATQTEADGSFTFIGVKPGNYTVSASNQAGDSTQLNNVNVTISNSTQCNLAIN
jgi:hypothetical protein